MASIRMRTKKNGTRVFEIRVTVEGTTYCHSYPAKGEASIPSTWSDKRACTEAGKRAARFEEDCKRGAVSNDKRKFCEYARYVIDLKESNNKLKASTCEKYRDLLKRIDASDLGQAKVRDITVKMLNAFYMELSKDGQNLNSGGKLSTSTIRKYHALISSVLHEAARESIILINPAQNATLPTVDREESNFFTPEKVEAILEAVEHEPLYWKAMTHIFIGIGARRGEVLGLKWEDIDFESSVISIRRNVYLVDGEITDSTPKTRKGRHVSIDPGFLTALREWRIEQAKQMGGVISLSGYCFALEDMGTPIQPSSVTRYYARFGERYGLGHINPHAFRHFHAAYSVSEGVDINTVSFRMGHSRASTTLNYYGHLMPQKDREAANKVGAAFLKANRG